MKCHYEVLEIARDADDATIKTAYRKLALRWHPDKNLNDLENAKTKFQFIQQAYEVLSDPQERSWYDRHREQILRGKEEYSDECLDVFQYFTASCYKGFDDSAGGFYAIYKDVFERISTEDMDFMDSDDEIDSIPNFGNSTSEYDSVVGPFYAYWQSYCTKKSYAWLCEYNVSEIRDRRILRHIEKDTKKITQKAKRERNEEVRALVAFVKKRDKRVVEYRKFLEQKAEANRVKQQEKRLQQIRKNQQEAEEMRLQQQKTGSGFQFDHEAQLRQLENSYRSDNDSDEEDDDDDDDDDEDDAIDVNNSDNDKKSNAQDTEISKNLENGVILSAEASGSVDEPEQEEYIDHLYCVACNKSFKNEASMKNHEPSKKHKENIEKLRLEMLIEDEDFEDSDDENLDSDIDEEINQDDDKHESSLHENIDDNVEKDEDKELSEEEIIKPTTKSKQKKSKKKSQQIYFDEDLFDDDGNEFYKPEVIKDDEKVTQRASSKKSKKKLDKKIITVEIVKNGSIELTTTKKSVNIKIGAKKLTRPSDSSDIDEDEATISTTAARNSSKMFPANNWSDNEEDYDDDGGGGGGKRKPSKKSIKQKKAAAKKSATKFIPADLVDDVDLNHTCVTCQCNFESKNKLFHHLKQMNHGVYIEGVTKAPMMAAAASMASSSGKKSKRK